MLFTPLYQLHLSLIGLLQGALQWGYFSPMFRARLTQEAPRLQLYSGMPQILGPLSITAGRDCRISGKTSFFGRASGSGSHLQIGNNCDIGWQCNIAVAGQVVLGDNVRLAGRCHLAGFPGHPLSAPERAAGLPEQDKQCGDIVLENDVWLCTGVFVGAGITIGRGTVVAAGSVVTADLPANVLAGGVPARVIRPLAPTQHSKEAV
ncbi:acyltransferase [Ferrimonas pelagia]